MFSKFRRLASQYTHLARATQQQDRYSTNPTYTFAALTVVAALGITLQQQKSNEAELGIGTFQIPKMIQEREAQKKKEYAERQKVDVEAITSGELSSEDTRELSETDRAFMFEQSELAAPDMEPEEDEEDDIDLQSIKDPYVKKKSKQYKH